MGNKNSKQNKNFQETQKQQFVIDHPKINNVIIYKTNEDLEGGMHAIVPITDKKQYDEWVKQIKHSPELSSTYAFKPSKFNIKKDRTCGKSGVAQIQYPIYPYILKNQIANRREAGYKKFEQTQVWYLLNCLADVAYRFHECKLKVGDIRPENIFANYEGELKIATQHSWPNQLTNYQKYFENNQLTNLSPQQFKDIEFGRKVSIVDIDLAESFSIGCTALDLALLDQNEGIYRNNNFDFSALDTKKHKIINDSKYSQLLKIVIINLTSINPHQRLTSAELKEFLRPNQANIVALQKFTVNDIPQKLKQTVKIMNLPTNSFPENKSQLTKDSKPNSTNYRLSLAQVQSKVAQSRAKHP